MNTIPFKVIKNVIKKVGGYTMASHENNYTKFHFEFSEDWIKPGIQLSVNMFFDPDNIPDPVLMDMKEDGTAFCYIPNALKDESGQLYIGITGTYADENGNQVTINTLLTSLSIGNGGFMVKYPANDVYLDILYKVSQYEKPIELINKKINLENIIGFNSQGYPVINISSKENITAGFIENSDIKILYIPNTVKNIQSGAFYNSTNIKSVFINNSKSDIDIGTSAFSSNPQIMYSDNPLQIIKLIILAIEQLSKLYTNDEIDGFVNQLNESKVSLEELPSKIISDVPSDTTTYSGNKLDNLLRYKIGKVDIRGADMASVPTVLTRVQVEGTTLTFNFTKLFNDEAPSEKTTFSGIKLQEMFSNAQEEINRLLDTKEIKSNKLTTGSTSDKERLYPSLAYIEKYIYSKSEADKLLLDKIGTVAIRGTDIKTIPSYLTLAQKEGTNLALYFTKLFNDEAPSEKSTFSSQKIDDLLYDKEDNSNKVTTGSPSYKEAQYPSLAYLEKYNYSKIETDSKLADLKTALDLGLYIDENGDICQKEE